MEKEEKREKDEKGTAKKRKKGTDLFYVFVILGTLLASHLKIQCIKKAS